ncbi:MAG: histidine kinase [Crocinitomicaceae bacterium]|nr:histidine kinase [Flavobacteriales bacterium]NQZ34838.1 histidine kinase [Crocinitomicaceae bacterium]
MYKEKVVDLRRSTLAILVLFGLLLSSNTLVAQEGFWHPVYKNYTTADGLPSMEGYYSVQDKDGYMWFATDRGVARFNGEEFKLFTTDDGLISNTIFKIAPDDKGRMWFLSNVAKLCYYENGKIIPYEFNDKLVAHFKGREILAYTSWKFKNDGVMLSASSIAPIHINEWGKVSLPKGNIEQGVPWKVALFLHEGELMKVVNNVDVDALKITVDIDVLHKAKIDIDYTDPRHSCMGWLDENAIYYSQSSSLITSSNRESKVYSFAKIIINISKTKGGLWISFRGGGIQRFIWKNDSLTPDIHLFKDKMVTSAFEDDEGHLWFTSLNSGIFKVSDMRIGRLTGFPELNESIISIGSQGDRLLISSDHYGFHVYNNALRGMEMLEGQPKKLSYDGLYSVPGTNEIFVVAFDEDDNSVYRFNQSRFEVFARGINMLTARKLDKKTVLFGDRTAIYWIAETLKSIPIADGARSIEFKDDHSLWIGNFGTLKIFDLTTKTTSEPTIKLLQQRMNDILKVGDYTLFGTNGNGLILKNGQSIVQFNSGNGFPRNFIDKIRAGKNGEIWVLGYDGITQFALGKSGAHLIQDFPASRMTAEKLNDFSVGENFIYLATNNGVVRINNNVNKSKVTPPRLHLTGIEINGTPMEIEDMNLPYSSNNVLIKFDAVSFENRPVIFRFRSHPTDEWTIITERFVRLTSLSFGAYQFEIQASIDQKKWVSSEHVNITIYPPFWKRWWFIFLVVVLFIILTALLILIRIKAVKEKYLGQQKILQMQQEALSQQMNPHFIFNALGSVQNSILKGETLLANSYLVKFSRLLRTGLNASRSQLISLKEDSELIRNYLSVEQTRMKKSFAFSVLIESKSASSLLIPPFLLQPFVENAIKHGFSDKVNDIYILVKYEEREKDILCVISDNGAGRKASKNNSNGTIEHESHGSDIAFQRILLISKSKGFTSRIETLDLRDKKGNSTGTKVVFTIPIIRK